MTICPITQCGQVMVQEGDTLRCPLCKIPVYHPTTVIIDSLGVYKTRGGLKVFITSIQGTTTHNCHGYYKKMRRGKLVPVYWSWDDKGRSVFVGKSQLDIVEKVRETYNG